MRMTLSRKTRVVEAPLPRSVLLRSRPLRNPSITWGPDKSGDMVIHVPLVKKPWMARFGRFLPTAEVRHIILDDIGADVWELCDGETSIDSIRRSIADRLTAQAVPSACPDRLRRGDRAIPARRGTQSNLRGKYVPGAHGAPGLPTTA